MVNPAPIVDELSRSKAITCPPNSVSILPDGSLLRKAIETSPDRSCLSREQKYTFSKETSASKLWKALEEKFLKKNSQNKLHMKKRLFRFSYVPGTTMNEHITNFNQLVADLLNLDVTFEDEDLALMLLGSILII